MKTLEFLYQETEIHFLINPSEKNVMINATEMAKHFDKRPKDFLRLENTKNYIEVLINKLNIDADVRRYNHDDILFTNNKAGTLMHRKLALKFAAWLDAEFELWIIDTIDEILFGNYSKHWDAHARQEMARIKMEEIKKEILLHPTPEKVSEYFLQEKIMNTAKKSKTNAIRNQLKLFGN